MTKAQKQHPNMAANSHRFSPLSRPSGPQLISDDNVNLPHHRTHSIVSKPQPGKPSVSLKSPANLQGPNVIPADVCEFTKGPSMSPGLTEYTTDTSMSPDLNEFTQGLSLPLDLSVFQQRPTMIPNYSAYPHGANMTPILQHRPNMIPNQAMCPQGLNMPPHCSAYPQGPNISSNNATYPQGSDMANDHPAHLRNSNASSSSAKSIYSMTEPCEADPYFFGVVTPGEKQSPLVHPVALNLRYPWQSGTDTHWSNVPGVWMPNAMTIMKCRADVMPRGLSADPALLSQQRRQSFG